MWTNSIPLISSSLHVLWKHFSTTDVNLKRRTEELLKPVKGSVTSTISLRHNSGGHPRSTPRARVHSSFGRRGRFHSVPCEAHPAHRCRRGNLFVGRRRA